MSRRVRRRRGAGQQALETPATPVSWQLGWEDPPELLRDSRPWLGIGTLRPSIPDTKSRIWRKRSSADILTPFDRSEGTRSWVFSPGMFAFSASLSLVPGFDCCYGLGAWGAPFLIPACGLSHYIRINITYVIITYIYIHACARRARFRRRVGCWLKGAGTHDWR